MIISIQYLRAIAALLVITAHFKLPYISHLCGAIGVDIFFVISGYIMSISAPKHFSKPFRFLVYRIIRIYPLYLILSLPFFLQAVINNDFDQVFKSLFFLGGDGDVYKDPLLFAGWSLYFEMIFYVLIILIRDTRITALICILIGLIGFLSFNSWINYIFNQFWILFAIGIFLDQIDNYLPKIHYRLSIVVSLAFLGFGMMFHDDVTDVNNYLPRLLVRYNDYVFPRIPLYGLTALIFIIYFRRFVELSKFKSRFLKIAGDYSYSIYLAHTAIYLVATYITDKFNL